MGATKGVNPPPRKSVEKPPSKPQLKKKPTKKPKSPPPLPKKEHEPVPVKPVEEKKPAYIKMGRPSKYRATFPDQMLEYFCREPREKLMRYITRKDGTEIEEEYYVGCALPTIEGFANRVIGVSVDTLLQWCEVHPEFSEAYKRAKAFQKEILQVNLCNGLYPAAGAIFTAKNVTDMRDQIDIKTTDEPKVSESELDEAIERLMAKAQTKPKAKTP